MVKFRSLLIMLSAMLIVACQSDGAKSGILQKVSHKAIGNYYVAEIAYAGGKVVGTKGESGYENTQEFQIDHSQFNELKEHLGENIVVNYIDKAFVFVGPTKTIQSYKFRENQGLTGSDEAAKIPEN